MTLRLRALFSMAQRHPLASLGLGVMTGGLVAIAVHARAPSPRVAPSLAHTPSALAAPASGTSLTARASVASLDQAPRAARATAEHKPASDHDELVRAFASDDDAKKIDAVEDAVRDGQLAALPALAAIDLRREPEAAPTIIHGVANLGVQGDKEDRRLATHTLSRWLRDESQRAFAATTSGSDEARDAVGNVPNLIDALGEVGGHEAVDTLIDALDSGRLDLSVETLTVQKLGDLQDRRATPAIERFGERVRIARPTARDDFERQLHDEASAEVKTALERIALGR